MSTYITNLGDTWDLIAYKKMGAERYMQPLIRANPDLADTLVFSTGVKVLIPDVDAQTAIDDLPFWHSGDDNTIWLTE